MRDFESFEEVVTVVKAYETLAETMEQWQRQKTRENLGLSNEETEKAPSVYETR